MFKKGLRCRPTTRWTRLPVMSRGAGRDSGSCGRDCAACDQCGAGRYQGLGRKTGGACEAAAPLPPVSCLALLLLIPPSLVLGLYPFSCPSSLLLPASSSSSYPREGRPCVSCPSSPSSPSSPSLLTHLPPPPRQMQ